jgi:hypothetical protein
MFLSPFPSHSFLLNHLLTHPSKLPATKKIRLAYMGKILREGSSLLSQGWKQGHVVNALVFSR